MGISFSYATHLSKEDGVRLIRDAVDRGVTFFDTAEVYGPFENEEVVGEALRPVRDQVVIATKFGFDIVSRRARTGASTAGPSTSAQAVDGSLKRLGSRRSTCFISTASTRTCRSRTWPARSRS